MAQKKVTKEIILTKTPKPLKKATSVVRVTKSKLPIKKTIIKNTVTVAKVPVVKKAVTVKKNLKKAPVEAKTEVAATDIVSLPTNAPLRLIRKSIVLKQFFEPHVVQSAYKIAYVSSICFVLVGTVLAVSSLTSGQTTPKNQRSNLAEVIGSSSLLNNTLSTSLIEPVEESGTVVSSDPVLTTAVEGTYIKPVEFDFITSIPDHFTDDLKIVFVATNAKSVVSKIIPIGKSGNISVNTEILPDSKYRTIISPLKLESGYYQLRVYVESLNGDPVKSFASPQFYVGTKEVVNAVVTTSEEVSGTPVTSTDTSPAGTATETTSHDTTSEITTQDTASETTTVAPSPAPAPEKVASTTSILSKFMIYSPRGEISGTAVIGTKESTSYTFVELYARPVQSITPRFIALATKQSGVWQFVFNSNNIPNGDYEFFAKTRIDSKDVRSAPLNIKVKNEFVQKSTVSSSTILKSINIESPREFTPVTPIPVTTEPNDDEEIKSVTEALLRDNSEEISELMRRYSLAIQTGDTSLINDIKRLLDKKRSEIVLKTLKDKGKRDYSDDIDREIEKNIVALQERVVVFEEVRRQRSEGQTAIDTDADGISDLDEIKLYKTDPNSADTDNDGITDGIEIIQGFDPLDAISEAVITFQSPKESAGLIRDDVLVIEDVISVVATAATEVSQVAAEIRGRALPNSFVTLYIFSSPTVVTIKTDADGSFVYTYDKELEDGKHDVYVTMTDNTGSIVAQSNPFSFIKEAQAFTPVAAAEAEIVNADTSIQSAGGTYNVVVGVGILALGLILLMLGVSLRSKEEEIKLISTTTDTDIS
ncbi:MAG: hypothetical protein RLZZ230_628 [Candidatus Parcubacteria bacterium]|jgi:hypothetical protein